MPRTTRLFLANMPLHIVQRGHDRQPVFIQDRDYQNYLDNMAEVKVDLSVQVYAYCLMANHVHLVVAPGEEVSGVSRFMRVVAGRQTRFVNKLEGRSGTLWEGRFKASLIDTDAYLLACCRYVDLNPVRAAMVAAPAEYRWSSYRCHTAVESTEWLDEHPLFRELGGSRDVRAQAYREFVEDGIGDAELHMIRKAVQRNQLTGDNAFQDAVAMRTGHRVYSRGRGRPGRS